MQNFILFYNTWMNRLTGWLGDWLLTHGARFTFAAVLLGYYWASAMTKFSDGAWGFLSPTVGAYYQILPTITEALQYDPADISIFLKLVVLLGSWAEVILPILIVLGLFTRGASLAMIGFISVQSLTDIFGHKVDDATIGSWFDRISDALILDQRLLWVFVLIVLVVKGAGRLSLDYLLKIDR